MADKVSTLAKVDTFRAEVAAIGGNPPSTPAPTIANATATPSSLPAPGNVVVDATVTNAMWVSVDGVQQALPATVAVASSRSIPLLAHGVTAPDATASISVTVASSPPPGDLSWFTSKPSGSITNIGTATLNAINPCPQNNCAWSGNTKFQAILAASGSVYLPGLGRAGVVAHRGGGHSDYLGNELMVFDLFIQAWTMAKPPFSPLLVGPNGYHAETATGLLWANTAGSATVPNEYSSGHTYGQAVALQLGLGTSDPLGAVLYTGLPSLTPGGQQHGLSCFVFEFSTNKYAPFAGPMPASQPEYSCSFLDIGRRRAVIPAMSPGSGKLIGLNLDTKVYTTIAGNLPTSLVHMVWGHDLAHDLYVGVRPPPAAGYSAEVRIVDPNTGTYTSPGLNVAWPWPAGVSTMGGGYWSELLGGIVYYHGQGEQSIRLVKPPTSGNPRTTAWSVQVNNFTGDASPADTMKGAGANCKRAMEMPAANGMLWLGQTASPVQFWKY